MITCLGGNMGKDIFSKKSRFSIRKLNIGVCSVLLGAPLIMIGHTAQADETTSDGATVAASSCKGASQKVKEFRPNFAKTASKVSQLLR